MNDMPICFELPLRLVPLIIIIIIIIIVKFIKRHTQSYRGVSGGVNQAA